MVASYRLASAVLLGLCTAIPSLPQITTAEITGTITDPGGAVVAGANITVTNTANAATRTTTTNEEGVYRLPSLSPGLYTLRIECTGFTAQVRTGVELQVAQVGRIDVALQVGNVSETVEVKAAVPLIDTDTTSLGTVIENQRIVELPLNGRNYLQLTALQAKFQHRLSNGLNLLSAYTYGKSIDNNSAYRTQFGDGGTSDPYNKRSLRGRSAFDFRQNRNNSLLFELPFGRGRHFGSTMSRAADTVVGGWQVGSIITMVTGFPSTPGCGSGAVQNGDGGCYPDATGISPKLDRGQ